MTRPVSRVGRRHSEQRLADVLAGIAEDKRTDDDGRDHVPDPPARWDEERALARMEDAYEREIERNHP